MPNGFNGKGLDYESLDKQINKKYYKLSDVSHKLEKIAFDVVRFKDGEVNNLWQVQQMDDGEYIVALYQEDDKLEKTASLSSKNINNWNVITSNGQINIIYKNYPIKKMAASKLGIPENEIVLLKKYLPNKLANNKEFVLKLLNTMSSKERNEVLSKYPELGDNEKSL